MYKLFHALISFYNSTFFFLYARKKNKTGLINWRGLSQSARILLALHKSLKLIKAKYITHFSNHSTLKNHSGLISLNNECVTEKETSQTLRYTINTTTQILPA